MQKGKFITIEGCEGVGKSSQIKLLKEYCIDNNIDAVFTREPGGTPVAEKIRDIILDAGNTSIDDMTELLLYSAARRQHIKELIAPALEAGRIVFCDRFTDSTLAYQGYGRGLDRDKILQINAWVLGNVKIDHTVFLDLTPENGFKRKGGANSLDRLENEKMDFFNRVYTGFKEIAATDSGRYITVDASYERGETHLTILSELKKRNILT